MKYFKLIEIVEKLEILVRSTKECCEQFHQLTEVCCTKIKQLDKNNNDHIKYYLTRWFYRYLGRKDEVYVLITGELYRSYHKLFHKEFLHDRLREKSYYSHKCELSLCSSNGLDLEYRILTEKSGTSISKLNKLADAIQTIEEKLDNFSKDLDYDAEMFVKSLRSHFSVFSIELGMEKQLEYIIVYITEKVGVIECSRSRLPEIKPMERERSLSLSASIKDHKDLRSEKLVITTNPNEHVKANDDDDDNKEITTEDEEVLSIPEINPFGMTGEISIRSIKRDYYKDSDGDSDEELNNQDTSTSPSFASHSKRHVDQIKSRRIVEYVDTIHHRFPQPFKTSLLVNLKRLKSVSSSRDVDIDNEINSMNIKFEYTGDDKASSFFVDVSTILDTISHRLWLLTPPIIQLPCSVRWEHKIYSRGDLIEVKLNNEGRTLWAIPFREERSLNDRIIRTFLELVVKNIVTAKTKPVNSTSEDFEDLSDAEDEEGDTVSHPEESCQEDVSSILFIVEKCVSYLSQCQDLGSNIIQHQQEQLDIDDINDAAARDERGEDEGEGDIRTSPRIPISISLDFSDLNDIAYNVDMVDKVLSYMEESIVTVCMMVNSGLDSAEVKATIFSRLQSVKLSGMCIDSCDLLPVFLKHFAVVDASACNLSSRYLLLKDNDNVMVCEKLILSHNRIVAEECRGLNGDSSFQSMISSLHSNGYDVMVRSKWVQYAMALLGKQGSVMEVHLSHCFGTELEARVICAGVVLGLEMRSKGRGLGLGDVKAVVVQGLRAKYPDLARMFVEACTAVSPGLWVDCSGGLRVL